VLNPFYKKGWFLFFLAMLFITCIILLFRWRTKSLLSSKLALEQTVNKRTEQLKKSLEEKDVLLKEIHHRVKNNLEVISSLLELQSYSIQDPEAKAAMVASQSRVHSISIIHHKLYQSDQLAQIEFRSFAYDLFTQVSGVFLPANTKVDLKIEGEDVFLQLDVAVSLGLILNELFTNSFKYAVQVGGQGLFQIRIVSPLSADEPYRLLYQDNGPGLHADFDPLTSTSLGMKIVQLLTKQIGGELNIIRTQGTTFEVPFYKTKPTVH
jgi:two-component sensor histidine kinase